MLKYNPHNKQNARNLRKNMTDAERVIWSRVRRKQILEVQFYRQKPIANFIVDFYAPKLKLVVEIDGAQHFEAEYLQRDNVRDASLNALGLRVLRFDNHAVLTETDSVIEAIYQVAAVRITKIDNNV